MKQKINYEHLFWIIPLCVVLTIIISFIVTIEYSTGRHVYCYTMGFEDMKFEHYNSPDMDFYCIIDKSNQEGSRKIFISDSDYEGWAICQRFKNPVWVELQFSETIDILSSKCKK